jgi:hypothetical protein
LASPLSHEAVSCFAFWFSGLHADASAMKARINSDLALRAVRGGKWFWVTLLSEGMNRVAH